MTKPATDTRGIKLSPKELAYELCVSERTLQMWRLSQVGPPYRREVNRIYYYRNELDLWKESTKWG